MPSPFPGMDPYLESPVFWSSFHTRFMVAIAEAIEPQLGPEYYVEVETRTYRSPDREEDLLIGIPDAVVFTSQADTSVPEQQVIGISTATQSRPERVTAPVPLPVQERYLEVREMHTDKVVTVIELLSPKNKRSGEGRTAYETKRQLVLGSSTHLIELDLLRGGKPMLILGVQSTTAYRILVSRGYQRPTADLYGASLQEALPSFPIPLKPTDTEPVVLLQDVLNGLYDRARYITRIDYRQPVPPPTLLEAEQRWVEALLTSIRGGYGAS